jgi:hypothetical protein
MTMNEDDERECLQAEHAMDDKTYTKTEAVK